MWTGLWYGVIASSALVLGGALGAYWQAPHKLTGILLAFASGTLIAALAFELFPVAVDMGGLANSTTGLIAGAAVFVAFNQWLDKRIAPRAATGNKDENTQLVKEAARHETATHAVGFALLASVTLDGVPENLALGVSIEAQASLTLLIAIFASNFPEALVGATAMRKGHLSPRKVIGIWCAAAAILTVMVTIGQTAGQLPSRLMALLMSFAGGAVIASLADTLMPEAFERGRPLNAFATAAGFVVSFALADHG